MAHNDNLFRLAIIPAQAAQHPLSDDGVGLAIILAGQLIMLHVAVEAAGHILPAKAFAGSGQVAAHIAVIQPFMQFPLHSYRQVQPPGKDLCGLHGAGVGGSQNKRGAPQLRITGGVLYLFHPQWSERHIGAAWAVKAHGLRPVPIRLAVAYQVKCCFHGRIPFRQDVAFYLIIPYWPPFGKARRPKRRAPRRWAGSFGRV